MTSATLCASLEVAINHYIHLDVDAKTKLAPLAGKLVAIDIQGAGLVIYCYFGDDRVFILPHSDREPDCRMTGAPLSMARLGMGNKTPGALFASGVAIEGDMDTGRAVQRLFDGLEIDWEEQLSKYVGDVVAHQVGSVVREVFAWGKKTAETLAQNSVEYLQEESRDLPHPVEVEGFLNEVDQLRTDVDRLNARVKRLQSKFNEISEKQD
jgi:ubiquinone biosynthesis protein UbiJ